MGLGCHTRSDVLQDFEPGNPEVLVQIQIAVIALRGTGVSAEKYQLCSVRQFDRIPLQLHSRRVTGEVEDVGLELMCLGLAGRQKDLIAPGLQGINERFTGKVIRRAYLARLQQVADPLRLARPEPMFLVAEQPIHKRAIQLFKLLIADSVLRGGLARPRVPVGYIRIEIDFIACLLVALHAGQPFDLPTEQINFLVVLPLLRLLQDQLNELRFERAANTFNRVGVVPSIPPFPAMDRRGVLVELLGNSSDTPPLPVKGTGTAAGV